MDIPLDRLRPYPGNPNRMSPDRFAKLKGHIARTGRYEALVVRPIAPDNGRPRYEVLNGHHRLRALMELGQASARCDVWDVDDTEAAVLVATLNRLSGEDLPEKREALLTELLKSFDVPRLAELVPESAEELAELARSLAPTPVPAPAPPGELEPVEFLYFALSPEDREVVETALKATRQSDRSAALLALAEAFARDADG